MRITPVNAVIAALGCAGVVGLSGCMTEPVSQRSADEQICLHHHENSPEEQARCRLNPALRDGPPPDMSPRELPVRVEQP